jgi:hypothetical protein
MGPRITDYGSLFWCDICDHGYMAHEWDVDEGKCVGCTEANQDRYMEGQVF